jgi:hypothetical protein
MTTPYFDAVTPKPKRKNNVARIGDIDAFFAQANEKLEVLKARYGLNDWRIYVQAKRHDAMGNPRHFVEISCDPKQKLATIWFVRPNVLQEFMRDEALVWRALETEVQNIALHPVTSTRYVLDGCIDQLRTLYPDQITDTMRSTIQHLIKRSFEHLCDAMRETLERATK